MCQCDQRKRKESKGFCLYYDGVLESYLVTWNEACEMVEKISRTLDDDFDSQKVELYEMVLVNEMVKVPVGFRTITLQMMEPKL